MGLSASDYAQSLKQLLPRGKLWLLEQSSYLSGLMLAIGDELARIEQRGADLIEESDPRTASETLYDWERVLGIPNDQIPEIPATDEERRLAITQMLVRQGGQHEAFYVALALACGYAITISDLNGGDVFRAGDRCGSRVYGVERAFHWVVTVTAPSGDALSHTQLEAIFDRAKPAHTTVEFVYL